MRTMAARLWVVAVTPTPTPPRPAGARRRPWPPCPTTMRAGVAAEAAVAAAELLPPPPAHPHPPHPLRPPAWSTRWTRPPIRTRPGGGGVLAWTRRGRGEKSGGWGIGWAVRGVRVCVRPGETRAAEGIGHRKGRGRQPHAWPLSLSRRVEKIGSLRFSLSATARALPPTRPHSRHTHTHPCTLRPPPCCGAGQRRRPPPGHRPGPAARRPVAGGRSRSVERERERRPGPGRVRSTRTKEGAGAAHRRHTPRVGRADGAKGGMAAGSSGGPPPAPRFFSVAPRRRG